MQHKSFEEFTRLLAGEDKEGCVNFALEKLGSGELDVVTLYSEILAPAQNRQVCELDESHCIWKEHVRTSIVRTIIECAYPYILKERRKRGAPRNRKVIIGCPSEEYHEIGARMVADFFTILGFDVTFVGANTPQRALLGAIGHVRPKVIGISVTSFYNLVAAKKLIAELNDMRREKKLDFSIIAGGNAFLSNPESCGDLGIDAVLQSFADIERYCREI